jgi:NAD(P)H-dependent flavin oxidoreductase YrpB (nitropropane dioxygenase family)
VLVVAAGGIYDGRGLAMALALGAAGVWVGTRFVCATEAGAAPQHQQEIISADFSDTMRTLFYTGRPLRVKKKKPVLLWEGERRTEMQANLDKGTIPYQVL